jgi:hypothetical protein
VILHLPGGPPDDLDRLLREFYRAELPEPWPVLRRPEAPPSRPRAARPRRWTGLRRRLTVAASVALLLVGYLLLARAFPALSGGGTYIPGVTGDRTKIPHPITNPDHPAVPARSHADNARPLSSQADRH